MVRISGDRELRVVGSAVSAEHSSSSTSGVGSSPNFAVLYAPIETAQALSEQPGAANQVAMTLRDGASLGADRSG